MTNLVPLPNDRFGSKAAVTAPKRDFRYAPETGLDSDIAPGPFRATSGLMHRSEEPLFDHPVRLREKGGWKIETDCFRGFQAGD